MPRVIFKCPYLKGGRNRAGKMNVMFRSRRVFKNCAVLAEAGGEQIARGKQRIVSPGEMQELELDLPAIPNGAKSITIRIEQTGKELSQ